MTDNNRRPHWLVVILLVLIAVLLVANLVMMGFLLKQGKAVSTRTRRSLPCESVPVRFVLDEPECADKLLRAMNVTNVRILPRGSLLPGTGEEVAGIGANSSS